MSNPQRDSLPQPAYDVRLSERAQRDIDFATVHFAETASVQIAISWRDGLIEFLESLCTFPRRFPVAPERFQVEIRQALYRRQKSRVAYRILFQITGEDETANQTPTVRILHIRHAAARPITRKEARAIEARH